ASVKQVLARHRPSLTKVLHRLEGRAEWSVKAYVVPSPLWGEGRCERSERGVRGCQRSGQASAGEGSAYLLGRVRQRAAQEEACEQGHNHAKRIAAALSRIAEDLVLLPLREPEGGNGMLLLNAACLVRRDKAQAFLSALEKLDAQERRNGIRLNWAGPWPAYSFAGLHSSHSSHLSHSPDLDGTRSLKSNA
ncbi:MAG: GvpL/GvpF family gas vesicle protein, partial [Planctomycetota bacterium]